MWHTITVIKRFGDKNLPQDFQRMAIAKEHIELP